MAASNRSIHDKWTAYYKNMADPLVAEYYGYSNFYNLGYWDVDTRTPKEACENLMEQLLAFIPDKKGTILDVACGKGATTKYLLRYYQPSQVMGIDISDELLKACKRKAPDCTFTKMDAVHIGCKENSLDNVICVEAAHHFKTREKFLREVCRVLKRGGRLVLSDILVSIRMRKRSLYTAEENYVKDLKVYRELYRRAGFEDVELIDATDECWTSFYRYKARLMRAKFFMGEIDWRAFNRIMGNIRWILQTEAYYVLASARKADVEC
jgi:MPBQ/MSBQ methyltransferase